MFQGRFVSKIGDKNKNIIIIVLPILALIAWFFFMLNGEQNRKELLYKLMKDAHAADNTNQSRYHQTLKDINCSLKNVPDSEKDILLLYLKGSKENLEQKLIEDNLADSTKEHIRNSLEYIPCECRNET
jgi:hypothetical protein